MFQPDLEAASREELEINQLKHLKKLVRRVYERIPFYQKSFDANGVNIDEITSLSDIQKLPFTIKQDLRDAYPFGLFAVPRDEVVRLHASSGTTGQASVVGYTQADLDSWGTLVARAYSASGMTDQDTIQIAYGYGLFTGGLGAHMGGEKLGCTVVPMSAGNTKRQLQLLRDFEVTSLACTPSYALLIAEKARELGYDPATDFKLKQGIFGAEPFSQALRDQIEKAFNIKAFDIYGLSEVMGPGVAWECEEQNGLHVMEDHFLVEIIDSETGESLPDGEWGEVVFTTLQKECSPLIRYRTRDISRIIPGTCKCGRIFKRLDRIKGRDDDMLIVRGVNIFPSQIEQVIAEFDEVAPHYRITLTKVGPLDEITLEVEVAEGFPLDEIRSIERVRNTIAKELKSNLQVSIKVKVVEPQSIERSEGKSKRVVDLR